jgi:hypothetical protein
VRLVGRLALLAGIGYLALWLLPLTDKLGPPVGPWDEDRLRLAYDVLIVVFILGGLGAIVPKQVRDFLPSGPLWRLVMMFGVTLTFLQYAAFDTGQPLMMAEHVLKHLTEALGVDTVDFNVYRHWLHVHLAAKAHATWVDSPRGESVLVSDMVLIGIAWFLLDWSMRTTRHLLFAYDSAKRLVQGGLWAFWQYAPPRPPVDAHR